MSVVLDLADLRWAQEPVGSDTLARFVPVDKPKRRFNDTSWASLWQLKTSKREIPKSEG